MRDVGDTSATDSPWLYIVHTDIPEAKKTNVVLFHHLLYRRKQSYTGGSHVNKCNSGNDAMKVSIFAFVNPV